MKNLSNLLLTALFVFGLSAATLAQVQVPRESQRAEVAQTIGDARVAIVYHRPNVKGREIWGKLVPYGEVWRTGANDNTTFETSEDIMINGQKLAAGKYGLHTIPNKDEWTIIFNKVNDAWGSFTYDQKNDALRVKAKPQTAENSRETMMIEFDSVTPTTTNAVIEWEKVRVPFTIDAGDVNARMLIKLRDNIAKSSAGDASTQLGAKMTAANFVLDNKLKTAYPEAMTWIDDSLKMREAFGTLRARARIAAEMGNYKDAAMYGEKAVTAGKAAKPAINAEFMAEFEKDVASWKAKP
ncbi:MAG: DUF2911 domain-containing protein [Pyrinomonadaceae bacterium]